MISKTILDKKKNEALATCTDLGHKMSELVEEMGGLKAQCESCKMLVWVGVITGIAGGDACYRECKGNKS